MTEKRTPNPLPEISEQDAELLSAYIDDMLPPIERAELESRLENEDFLRDELAAMQQTVALVNQLPRLKAPRNFTITAADVQGVEVQKQAKRILRPNFAWTLAGTAAAVVVMIFGVLIVLGPTIGDVFPGVVNDLGAGAPMEAENIALQSTSAPASQADTRAADLEQAASLPTGTPLPTLAMTSTSLRMGIGATAMPPVVVDITSDMQDEDESAEEMSEADLDDSASQAAESQNAQEVRLSEVQQTATALSALFVATPTEAEGALLLFLGDTGADADKSTSDGNTASSSELALGGSGTTDGEAADDGTLESTPVAQTSADTVDSVAEVTQEGFPEEPSSSTSILPNTGGQADFIRLGQILLGWLIQLILEFLQ